MADSMFYSDQSIRHLLWRIDATPNSVITYSYGTSSDARQNSQSSEDYLCFEYSDNRIIFVVCDGVGQTFGADYAARFLSHKLMQFLGHSKSQIQLDQILSELREFLGSFLPDAQKYINTVPNIYLNEPTSVKYKYFESARKEGSEVKFIAGLINFKTGKLRVFSLGDLLFAAFDKRGQVLLEKENWLSNWIRQIKESQHPIKWDDDASWSTTKGIVNTNDLNAWEVDISRVSEILVASDGAFVPFVNVVTNHSRDPEADLRATYEMGKDDVSFLKIALKKSSDSKLQEVNYIGIHDGVISWTPINGADAYRVLFFRTDGTSVFHECEQGQTSTNYQPLQAIRSVQIQAISSRLSASEWAELQLTPWVEVANTLPQQLATFPENVHAPPRGAVIRQDTGPSLIPDNFADTPHFEEDRSSQPQNENGGSSPNSSSEKSRIRYITGFAATGAALFLLIVFAAVAPRQEQPQVTRISGATARTRTPVFAVGVTLSPSSIAASSNPETTSIVSPTSTPPLPTLTPILIQPLETVGIEPTQLRSIEPDETAQVVSTVLDSTGFLETTAEHTVEAIEAQISPSAMLIAIVIENTAEATFLVTEELESTTAFSVTPTPIEVTPDTATPAAGRCVNRQAPLDWMPYTIQANDTLYSVVRRFDMLPAEVPDIIRYNCFRGDVTSAGRDLQVGEVILIPPYTQETYLP